MVPFGIDHMREFTGWTARAPLDLLQTWWQKHPFSARQPFLSSSVVPGPRHRGALIASRPSHSGFSRLLQWLRAGLPISAVIGTFNADLGGTRRK